MIVAGDALPPFPLLTARHWFFIIQNFEQLALALKNRVALKLFTALKYFFLSRFLSNLRLPWKFSLYWIYFLHSRFLSNLRLPWKTECAEFTVLQWRNQLYISRGGNFYELSFDDVIVLIQPWYNFFVNRHRYVLFATFPEMRTY